MNVKIFARVFVIATLLLSLASSSALAAVMSLEITNRSGKDIVEFDIFGKNTDIAYHVLIHDRETKIVTFYTDDERVDFKLVFSDGDFRWGIDNQVNETETETWNVK